MNNCHRCMDNHPGLKTYECSDSKGNVWLFNVSAAYAFALERHCVQEIPMDWAKDLIITNLSETFCGAHVDHVDLTIPPLIGMLSNPNTKALGLILLDGTHRLFAKMKQHLPLVCLILDEQQTAMFLLAAGSGT